MENKNSAIDLTGLALAIIIMGISISIGVVVLIGVRDNRLTDLSTVSTNNESNFINETNYQFSNSGVTGYWGNSVSSCFANVTGAGTVTAANTSISAANYSVSISDLNGGMNIQNATDFVFIDSQCSYSSYNTSRADWAVADSAATGLLEYGNWFDILVIVGVAAVVLSLLFMAFGSRGVEAGSVSY